MRKKEYDDKTLHEYARLNRVTLFIYQEITFFWLNQRVNFYRNEFNFF